jgi:AraC family L-rhamnose operon transcriptional activator RhaR
MNMAGVPIRPLPGSEDLGLQRLTFTEMFPTVGPPIHVNHPTHRGDIPLHDHDFVEIAIVCDGHAVHRTIHGQQAIGKGDCFVMQPGQWHAYERAHELCIYNLCFGTDLLLRELSWARTDPVLSCLFPARVPSSADPKARRAAAQGVIALKFSDADLTLIGQELERLRAIQAQPDLVRVRSDAIGRLLLVLGIIGRTAAAGRKLETAVDLASGGPVAAAVQALEEQLDREWALDELAKLAKLNRSYFVRRFKRATGLSPMAYLARRRAEKAAVLLLTTDLPISQVGKLVGWHDPNYFARRFRQAFSMSAREYREQLPTPPLARDGEDWIQW